jgi:LCP family protein required for cell wall assembly
MRISPLFLIIVLLLVVFVTGAAAFGAYTLTRQFVAEAPIQLPQLPNLSSGAPIPAQVPTTQTDAAPTLAAAAPTNPTPATIAGAATVTLAAAPTTAPAVSGPAPLTRVTILLLGIDQRQGEKGNFRTDTMIVLSLDPLKKTGVLLSVPRDIYLQIPGTQVRNRINAAFDIGGQINYPGGPAALSLKTVQSVIGVKIHHYAVINFDVFNAVIDAIGPIQVCNPSVIDDKNYPDGSYGFITVHFDAGCQDLDSTRLLQYARVRHNAGDDFGRSTRQQEVIRAVQTKILSMGGMSALLGKAGTLWASIRNSVQTDMTFDEMIQIAQIAQTIPRENIASAVLSDKENYVLPATTAQGEQVLTPNYEKIHALIESLFDGKPPPPSAGPAVTAAAPTNGLATSQPNAVNPAVASAASAAAASAVSDDGSGVIQVLNGAGIDGLGKKTVDQIRAKGLNVLDAAKNADTSAGLYALSQIKVYTGKLQTAKKLAAALNLDGSVIQIATDGPPGVDIDLIVGTEIGKR